MKKYKVNVNGTAYEVEVEEISGATAPVAAPAATVVAPSVAPAGAEVITAPMPGNILDVKVKAGDSVKKGQVLMVLEAMKMENEIMCPRDGKIASVDVAKGTTVDTGAQLCVLE